MPTNAHIYESESNQPHAVAIKATESEVNAPEHAHWVSVKCGSCSEVFFIGPSHIYAAPGKTEYYVRRLESILARDHDRSRPHRTTYDLDW